MIKAIDEYHVEGVATTLPFGKFVMQHEAFRSGDFDTGFVKKYNPEQLKNKIKKPKCCSSCLETIFRGKTNITSTNKLNHGR
jgi:acetyl/propionyl-CoA carboxylase alpha subunit